MRGQAPHLPDFHLEFVADDNGAELAIEPTVVVDPSVAGLSAPVGWPLASR